MLEPQFQEVLSEEDSLFVWRKKAWDRFRDLGSLSCKQEMFRHVSIKDIDFPPPAKENLEQMVLPSSFTNALVFVDGFFRSDLSSFPEEISVMSLEEAMHSYGVFLQTKMSKSIKEETDPLAALNGAFQGRGAFVYIPAKTELKEPLVIEHVFTTTDMATPKAVLYFGKQAKAQVVQKIRNGEGDPFFANHHVDFILDEGAFLQLQVVQKQESSSCFFQAIRASLKKDSRLELALYGEGAKLSRHAIQVQLLEVGAEAKLRGLSKIEKQRQNHIYTEVEHLAPSARSHQHFKALLNDASLSSFEGKIFVHSIAQKTESYQLSNNLLLSDAATAFTKPNLEVFADDVKASHGATIFQLDAEHLFYLRSRGLSEKEAKQHLIDGFTREYAELL